MYLKNLTRSLRVRVSDEDFEWVSMWADELGISVSDFIRQLIRKDKASTLAEVESDYIMSLDALDAFYVEDDLEGGDDNGNESAGIFHII